VARAGAEGFRIERGLLSGMQAALTKAAAATSENSQ
jgi:hypothetical protein